jgi:hypothetical protein
MVGMTYDGDVQQAYKTPKSHINCPSQYQAPGSDEDVNPALIARRDMSVTRVDSLNVGRTANGFAMTNGFESRAALPIEMNGSVARYLRGKAFKNARRPGALTGERAAVVPAAAGRMDVDAAWPPG